MSINFDALDEKELKRLLIELDKATGSEGDAAELKTDDELHTWIKKNLGIDIPRVSVCPDHDPPFDFIADLFFEREDAALVMANRGGGKSYLAATWLFLNNYWKPGTECLSVGAIDIQSKRVYSHIKQFQARAAQDKIISSTITETLWKNNGKMEIVTGSLSSVNGPHSQKVHRDEIELMDKAVLDESMQIERAKRIDGREISSQTLLTSTRKTSAGIMQTLLDECDKAIKDGRKPPYRVYKFCIKECISNVPNCRVANPDLPESEKCDCDQVRQGEWREGKPRTFDQICNGLFAKSQGFIPVDDAQKTFVKSSKAMWEAQQECKRPYVEDISFENWSREQNVIKGWDFDPANGPIYMGIDFGGSNPHSAIWGQLLEHEVECVNYFEEEGRMTEGSLVFFDIVYHAHIGNNKFAKMIVQKERAYKRTFPYFRVERRFADRQASAARKDFAENNPPLICSWPIVTRDREEHFKSLYDRIEDKKFFVLSPQVDIFAEEIEVWNIENVGKKKIFDHSMDSGLYLSSNLNKAEEKRRHAIDAHTPTASKKSMTGKKPNPFNDHVPGAVGSGLHSPIPGLHRGNIIR